MIIRHLGKFVAISFAPRDWKEGEPCRAKKAIEFIKTMPVKARRYNPKKKEWVIDVKLLESGKLNEIFRLNSSYPEVQR